MRLHPALTIALSLAALTAPLPAAAQGAAQGAKPPARQPAKAVPATPRQQLKNEAKGLALATETVEEISEAQLAVAAQVLTGTAACEFNQQISITAVDGQPGHFVVGHKGVRYHMTPRETSTGAVRLEDKTRGVVWLQIPAKSMLMNARAGQRMVDSCQLAEQRVAVAPTGAGIGIVPVEADKTAAAPAAGTTAR